MKTKLLSAFFSMAFMGLSAQENIVNLSMESSYNKDVYFKFKNENITNLEKNVWDVAFLSESSYTQSIRFNQSRGLELYQASDNIADWNSINIENIGTWTALNNGTNSWDDGGFMQGTATYGWGEYNPSNHHVSGSIIFVLKYSTAIYKKIIVEDYYGGYTLKYATFDANTSAWSEDKSITVPNNSSTNRYNYYSLENEQVATEVPEDSQWDLVFNKYVTDVGGGYMYPVTGVFQNKGVSISKSTNLTNQSDIDALEYSENISTIGYDWKAYNGAGYSVNSEDYFFIKDESENVYKMNFLSFEGASTGNISFKYQDITNGLSIEKVDQNVSFSIYPNPTLNKEVNVVYDVENSDFKINKVEVMTLAGSLVHSEKLTNNSGLYHHKLNLNHLNKGVYLLRFSTGSKSKTQKLIIQ